MVASVRIVCSLSFNSTIRSMSRKYSRRMQPRLRGRRALGGDQLVDARAEVLEHKVLLGCRLAVIDLLGPLLERQLDPERLVDRKSDIEEIEAIDPEIVDGVAVRRDLLALDVACFGNDVRHGVESRRHRQPSEMCRLLAVAPDRAHSPGRMIGPVRPVLSCGARITQGFGSVQWRQGHGTFRTEPASRPNWWRRPSLYIGQHAAHKGLHATVDCGLEFIGSGCNRG